MSTRRGSRNESRARSRSSTPTPKVSASWRRCLHLRILAAGNETRRSHLRFASGRLWQTAPGARDPVGYLRTFEFRDRVAADEQCFEHGRLSRRGGNVRRKWSSTNVSGHGGEGGDPAVVQSWTGHRPSFRY